MPIKIKLEEEDEESLTRVLQLQLSNSTLRTPNYAVNVRELDKEYFTTEYLRGFAELSIYLSPDSLDRMINDSKFRDERGNNLRQLVQRVPKDQAIIVLPIIKPGKKSINQLNEKELTEYIHQAVDISFVPGASIVCAPMLQDIPDKLQYEIINEFLTYASSLYAYLAPSISYDSRRTQAELIKLYGDLVSKNNRILNNFICIDYYGSNPIGRYPFHNYVLNTFKRAEKELGYPIVLYGANVKYGKVGPKYSELPARDLASYFVGIDIIGPNHKKLVQPREIVEKMEANMRIKLLDREKYLYKSIESKALGDIIREKIETLSKESLDKFARKYNARESIIEAEYLREHIFKKDKDIRPLKYLMEKEAIKYDNRMKNIVIKITQQNMKTKSLWDYSKQ
jgi:hypothetical protein